MSAFPGSPRQVKGCLVLLDPDTGTTRWSVTLQYNPDTLSRTLQVQGVSEGGDRSEALRLKGPPVETIKIDAEIDATDQMEEGRSLENGIHPQLAALETIIYPDSKSLLRNDRMASSGQLEIIPVQAPLCLFIWSGNRIVPVRITDFSVTEEAFDTALNPIRAKVSLGMRVLNVNDLGFSNTGGSLFMQYLQNKEKLRSVYAGNAPSPPGTGEF
jgi:hypothetical protein